MRGCALSLLLFISYWPSAFLQGNLWFDLSTSVVRFLGLGLDGGCIRLPHGAAVHKLVELCLCHGRRSAIHILDPIYLPLIRSSLENGVSLEIDQVLTRKMQH